VIVLDANILLYAYDSSSSQHAKARTWVEEVFSGTAPVVLPWQTITAFLRITTNPRLPGHRFGIAEAAAIVDQWLEQPNIHVISQADGHWPVLRRTIMEGQASGAMISDAQLAALTIESGGVLHTTDRDFARFPGLRWTNPLA
jgi:toxin-antitoxin system PIN domain toxin